MVPIQLFAISIAVEIGVNKHGINAQLAGLYHT